jgi:hypothetical protein
MSLTPSAANCRLSGGCDKSSRAAARVKWRVLARVTKLRSGFTSITTQKAYYRIHKTVLDYISENA